MKSKLLKTIFFALITTLCACSMLEERFGKIAPADAIGAGSDLLKAATLSDEDVIKIAGQVAAEMDRTNTIADASSPYSKRLSSLVTKHSTEDGLKLNYKAYINPEVNAFSLADGTIRVYSGLMDKMNDQELLFVIGHEIGHVKNGHSKVRLQRAYAANAALGAASSSLAAGANSAGGVATAIGGELLAVLVSEVIKAQFSQSDETESDEYGTRFLHRYGNSPDAAVAALLKLGEDEAEDGSSMMNQLTSSHPNPIERSEHIKVFMASLGSNPSRPVQVAKTDQQEFSAGHQPNETEPTNNTETTIHKVNMHGETYISDDSVSMPVKHTTLSATKHSNHTAPNRVSSGWYIQLGAFHDTTQAESMSAALKEREERATTQHAVVSGNDYERVLVGPYPTKQNAQIELDRVISHGIFDGDPFVRKLPE